MKTLHKFIVIFIFLIINYGCSDDDNITISMEAAIHSECLSTINFIGDDLYAYELTDPNLGTYYQVGGHPKNAVNEMPDLGANIFATTDGDYVISDNWGINKVFIYYIDEAGIQYTSTANNGNLTAHFEIENSQTVVFKNVEVYSAALDKTLCINNVEISYALP